MPIWLIIVWVVYIFFLCRSLFRAVKESKELFDETVGNFHGMSDEVQDIVVKIAVPLAVAICVFTLCYYVVSAVLIGVSWFAVLSGGLFAVELLMLPSEVKRTKEALHTGDASNLNLDRSRKVFLIRAPFMFLHAIAFGYFAFFGGIV